MNRLLKTAYVVSWIAPALVKLALVILGLVVVALAIVAYGHDSDDWPKFLGPWANRENASAPQWFAGKRPSFRKSWVWFAIRNPANGMRYWFKDRTDLHTDTNWPGDGTPMEARQMLARRVRVAWRWRWSGPFAGYRRVWINDNGHYSEIWFGWKIGSGVPGLGFTSQVRLKRKIGT